MGAAITLCKRRNMPMAEQVAPSPEGWFCFHLFRKIDRSICRQVPSRERQDCLDEFAVLVSVSCIRLQYEGKGGRCWCRVNGQEADLGLMILRGCRTGFRRSRPHWRSCTSSTIWSPRSPMSPSPRSVSIPANRRPTVSGSLYQRQSSPPRAGLYLHLPHVENPPTGCQLVHNSLRPPLDPDA